MCQVLTHCGFFRGSRWMEAAPTSIEILSRSTLGQSDEPSDLRGSLSECIQHLAVPGGHPSNYEPGATLPNFSDRDNHYERTPYSVSSFRDIIILVLPFQWFSRPDSDKISLHLCLVSFRDCLNPFIVLSRTVRTSLQSLYFSFALSMATLSQRTLHLNVSD